MAVVIGGTSQLSKQLRGAARTQQACPRLDQDQHLLQAVDPTCCLDGATTTAEGFQCLDLLGTCRRSESIPGLDAGRSSIDGRFNGDREQFLGQACHIENHPDG